MGMTNRETVINGLEICRVGHCDYRCPYASINVGCRDRLSDEAITLLKEQPEIVRCKDCKHFDEETGRCALLHVHGNAETWFCADGKQRDYVKPVTVEDVQEPIRCKYCQFYNEGENEVDSWMRCRLHSINTSPDEFCSWAVKNDHLSEEQHE